MCFSFRFNFSHQNGTPKFEVPNLQSVLRVCKIQRENKKSVHSRWNWGAKTEPKFFVHQASLPFSIFLPLFPGKPSGSRARCAHATRTLLGRHAQLRVGLPCSRLEPVSWSWAPAPRTRHASPWPVATWRGLHCPRGVWFIISEL